MTAIHVIEKGPSLVRKIQGTLAEFESGNWKIDLDKAERLVGGDLYLHSGQSSPSHFGGRIIGFRVLPVGEQDAGRVIFRFIFSERYRGVKSSGDWPPGEKKYDW